MSCGEPLYEGALFLWDVHRGRLVTRQTCLAEQHSATFAGDATMAFCTAGRGQCTLWTIRTGSEPLRIAQKQVPVARDETFAALAALPGEAAWLALGASGKLMALRLRGGQVEHQLVDAQVRC